MRPDQKREGPDWFAIFNPNVRRLLDVELKHTLIHESVVCCVRFSRDGRYVATGCNRSAQIFEVNSGNQVTKLQDDSVDKDGDLYIRSVCFSPDGMLLATGAEDKQIRVSRSRICPRRFFRLTNSKGLGHSKPYHQNHLCRSRARYLFLRLRYQWASHCLWQWGSYGPSLGYSRQSRAIQPCH